VRCHPERLDQPLHWRKPARIFVNSLSDLFHPDVPADFIAWVFYKMAISVQHTFQILTKRPERALEILSDIPRFAQETNLDCVWLRNGGEWPLSNVWLGVSVEDQKTADERIPPLLQTPAAVRWVSYEPALGPVDFRPWLADTWCLNGGCDWKGLESELNDTGREDGPECPSCGGNASLVEPDERLDWVVAGGESGPHARTSRPDWFRSVRDQCQAAGVPFFMKQMGGWPNKRGNLEDIPEDLRIRQFPAVKRMEKQ
jgi:protein gp37